MDAAPDSRFPPFITYEARFLWWWGLLLFCCKLSSRRQLDYELGDSETQVLCNVNRLACTAQESLPVNKTLEHFLGHVGPEAVAQLRTWCIRRLVRMKALDDYRLQGMFVVALDGTGMLRFRTRHCDHCLTQTHEQTVVYLHPVLEAKLVTVSGLALSVGSEFIENPGGDNEAADASDYQKHKQDCELAAFDRLAPALKRDFPQMPLCISGDSEYGCGRAMQLCKLHGWSFIFVFKPGRTPALWAEFEALLALTPENRRCVNLPDGTRQEYQWVNDLPYKDSEDRTHILNAIICKETVDATITTYAWLTILKVNAETVVEVATKGARVRIKIENQGFNTQKNSGLGLEHVYSTDWDNSKAFYYLLQIGHMLLQMLEKGSLLNNLASRYHATPVRLFGSLKNITRRLLECLRNAIIPDDAFDPVRAAACQIRLNTG